MRRLRRLDHERDKEQDHETTPSFHHSLLPTHYFTLYLLPISSITTAVSSAQTISAEAISDAIQTIAKEIAIQHAATDNLVLAGIANGGIPTSVILRDALEKELGRIIHIGVIDVSFHRDDFTLKPITKEVEATQLFHNPEDATIILVDDVLFSGRTIRAALAELHTLGRPNKVELAILVDRGNRKLPIAADYTGLKVDTTPDQQVTVTIDTANPSKNSIVIE